MTNLNKKEVYYYIYCSSCKFYDKHLHALETYEECEACEDCLSHPYNYDSHKPTRYILKDPNHETTES